MKSVFKRFGVALVSLLAIGVTPTLTQAATCDQFACKTMHDIIPNFAGQPTIRSLKTGAWSTPSTWNLGRIPTASDIVGITGGTIVTVDGTSAVARTVGVEALGKLAFRTDASTRLTVGTLQVLPQGALEIGTSATPVAAAVTAEVVIADLALDLTDDGSGVYDPRQFGTGLLAIDARVTMFGAAKTAFMRLATEPKVGDLTLVLSAPVAGWQTGDRVFLPDSKMVSTGSSAYTFEGEVLTVSSVSTDGKTVFLTSALKYNHPGARDGNDVLEFLPHVGNLSRNIVVRSANPLGTRGHVFFTERSEIDVRNMSVRNLGRATIDPLDSTTFDAAGKVLHMGTNHIGRYPMHLHHVLGPVTTPANGRQFTIVGNVVDDDAVINRHKWAITIHASHYGLINNNVVYNAGGWGIGTEDGSESYNEFSSNFIAKVRGEGTREYAESGDGMWFRGPNNYVRDNVVANVRGSVIEGAHGIQYYMVYVGNICVPNFKGADMMQCTTYSGNAMPLLENARNEVYGAMEIGMTIWWLGTVDLMPVAVAPSVVKDFRVWNFSYYGYYGYPANKLTFDGFVARGKKSLLSNINESAVGLYFGDYMNQDFTAIRADIQNVRTGIMAPYFSRGTTNIQDSYLRNAKNITIVTIGAPGSWPYGPNMPPKQTTITNVQFAPVNGNVGGVPQYDIYMKYWDQYGSANLVKRDAVYVYGYNKVAGDDFQVFYKEQDPSFIVPQSAGNLAGSPVAGLTNAQNWATYKIAIAGEVATNTVTRSFTNGLVRLGTPPPLPVLPTVTTQPLPVTVALGGKATFSVASTGTAPVTFQWQRNGANIAGATSTTYTIAATVATDNATTYRCLVSNGAGQVSSATVLLTVTGITPPATGGGTTTTTPPATGGGTTTGTNVEPKVNAGPDQTVRLSAGAKLVGTVTDDGLPDWGTLTRNWRLLSGPGSVTFGTAAANTTTVKFTKTGTYVIGLFASDGKLPGFDTVSVIVKP